MLYSAGLSRRHMPGNLNVKRSSRSVVLLCIGFIALLAILAAILHPFGLPLPGAAACGVGIGIVVTLGAVRLRFVSLQSLLGGFIGSLAGFLLGLVVVFVIIHPGVLRGPTAQFFRLVIPLAGGYLGGLAGIAKSERIRLDLLGIPAAAGPVSPLKLLDTSVLIDGRIADIAESGFLEGPLVIPQFVLHELQLVADSADSAKRNRGRRGLDVVQRLQKIPGVAVQVSGRDFPVREVDLKLIELAKQDKAKIVTNDFNLNKLAQVQGVVVLNINELANSLKPVVLPGEVMRVFILKEGKEHNQGVAYLDDGTMVVVDNARRLISKTVDITVTSVLQTTAGKMIFGRYDERLHSMTADHRSTAASAGSTAG